MFYMKKSTLYLGLALLCAGSLASCSSDPEYDSSQSLVTWEGGFKYNSQGVWTGNDQSGFLTIDGYEFSHIVDNGGYVYGFTPSKVADTTEHNPLVSFPYASAYGGGLSGAGSAYLVGYWAEYLENNADGAPVEFDQRTCRIYAEDGDEFKPQSVMVCNTTYMKYAAENGTAFSPKFKPGDYVTLIAHGVHLDGTESQSVFYLVNIESENVGDGILQAWQQFDLSGLGACTGVYFTMAASEDLTDPQWGLNVPTYFCIDRLVLKD